MNGERLKDIALYAALALLIAITAVAASHFIYGFIRATAYAPPADPGVLRVYHDTGTGCDYLASPTGATLVPRFGADGRQVCRRVQP